MSGPLERTTARTLGLAALLAGIATWGLTRTFYGDIPPLRWWTPLLFAVLAVVEVVMARQLRRRIAREPGTEPLHPLGAARAVALAKASSLLGAIFAGAWLGFLLYVAPQVGYLADAGSDTTTGVIGVACCGGLVAAALLLERALVVPEPPDEDDR